METFIDCVAAAVARKLGLDVTSRGPYLVRVQVAAERIGMSVAREDQAAGMAALVALRSGEPIQRRLSVMGGV